MKKFARTPQEPIVLSDEELALLKEKEEKKLQRKAAVKQAAVKYGAEIAVSAAVGIISGLIIKGVKTAVASRNDRELEELEEAPLDEVTEDEN